MRPFVGFDATCPAASGTRVEFDQAETGIPGSVSERDPRCSKRHLADAIGYGLAAHPPRDDAMTRVGRERIGIGPWACALGLRCAALRARLLLLSAYDTAGALGGWACCCYPSLGYGRARAGLVHAGHIDVAIAQ